MTYPEELEIFTCNNCGSSLSKNYYTKQGGVTAEDDENICDDCYEECDQT